jgi:hypothetical protein
MQQCNSADPWHTVAQMCSRCALLLVRLRGLGAQPVERALLLLHRLGQRQVVGLLCRWPKLRAAAALSQQANMHATCGGQLSHR